MRDSALSEFLLMHFQLEGEELSFGVRDLIRLCGCHGCPDARPPPPPRLLSNATARNAWCREDLGLRDGGAPGTVAAESLGASASL